MPSYEAPLLYLIYWWQHNLVMVCTECRFIVQSDSELRSGMCVCKCWEGYYNAQVWKDREHFNDNGKNAAPACDRCWVLEQTEQKNSSYHEGGARSSIAKSLNWRLGKESQWDSQIEELNLQFALNMHKKELRLIVDSCRFGGD